MRNCESALKLKERYKMQDERKFEIEAEFAKTLNILENRDKALTDMILKKSVSKSVLMRF